MELEYLNQELTERINSLQTELDTCKRQKEVLSIITSLKSIKNSKQGYNDVVTGMNISREGIADFVNLLSPDEYLKGYSSGGDYDSSVERETEHNYDIYYLTLGTGIVLELAFCETKIIGFNYPKKGNNFSIRSFADSQDLSIKVDNKTYEWPIIGILGQNGNSVFDSNTTDEYLKFNNQRLNEALMPISAEDLTSRFLNSLQRQEVKGPKKIEF